MILISCNQPALGTKLTKPAIECRRVIPERSVACARHHVDLSMPDEGGMLVHDGRSHDDIVSTVRNQYRQTQR